MDFTTTNDGSARQQPVVRTHLGQIAQHALLDTRLLKVDADRLDDIVNDLAVDRADVCVGHFGDPRLWSGAGSGVFLLKKRYRRYHAASRARTIPSRSQILTSVPLARNTCRLRPQILLKSHLSMLVDTSPSLAIVGVR